MSADRQAVRRRTEAQWVNARQWVPDTPRLVIVLVANPEGKLSAVNARYSLGWRFTNRRDKCRRPDRVRAWMDIPWWDRQKPTPETVPAGAQSRRVAAAADSAHSIATLGNEDSGGVPDRPQAGHAGTASHVQGSQRLGADGLTPAAAPLRGATFVDSAGNPVALSADAAQYFSHPCMRTKEGADACPWHRHWQALERYLCGLFDAGRVLPEPPE